MCCKRRQKREEAGKSPSMEIDEGPPPFHGSNVVDDPMSSFDVDHQNTSAGVDPDVFLPLPDVGRSRSVTPTSEVNQKGDTMMNSPQPQSEKDEHREEALEDDDDDDDWGDFGTAAAPIQQKQPAHPPPPVPVLQMEKDDDDDDDEEWAAFEHSRPSTDRPDNDSGPDSARSEAARQLAHQQSLEAWGAAEDDDDEDDWQAEFSSAPPAPLPTASVPVENLKMLEEMLDDDEFWDDGFQEQEEEELSFQNELCVSDIRSVFDSEALVEEAENFEMVEQRYARLWLSLRVVEEAISLKFDWKNSEIRTTHFKSLKINPKTVQKTVRPAKFDTSDLLLPTPIVQTSSSSDDPQKTPSPSDPAESPSIPAVDFDWDTSGLTNPMNRANQSSAIIDVDFLSTNGVATSYISPLQHDLEQFGLTLEKGAGSGATSLNGPNILETIMSRADANSSNRSRSPYRPSAELSLDAQKLLEKLPDLQYLQSEVLMFPMGTNLGPH